MDQHKLTMSVSARYVHFHPTKGVKENCLRVEIYGFASKPVKSKEVVTLFFKLSTYSQECLGTVAILSDTFHNETSDEGAAKV